MPSVSSERSVVPFPPEDQEDAESSSHALREAPDPEMRHKMHRTALLATLSLALVTGIAPASDGASITYNIQNYASLQNGYTLSGTITTDGNLGTLTGFDITAWSYTVTLGSTVVDNETSLTPEAFAAARNLMATATSLTLTPAPPTNGTMQFENFIVLGINEPHASSQLVWSRVGTGTIGQPAIDTYQEQVTFTTLIWNSTAQVPPGLTLGSEASWLIATLSVPEPGTLTLALLGIPCIAAGLWARRRFSRSHDDTASREFSAAQ
jgi:hypothetical protein